MIYINRHPTYDYSMAVVDNFYPDLKDIVKTKDYLTWIPGYPKQIMIQRNSEKPDSNLNEFLELIKPFAEIKICNEKTDEWEIIQ